MPRDPAALGREVLRGVLDGDEALRADVDDRAVEERDLRRGAGAGAHEVALAQHDARVGAQPVELADRLDLDVALDAREAGRRDGWRGGFGRRGGRSVPPIVVIVCAARERQDAEDRDVDRLVGDREPVKVVFGPAWFPL